MVNDPILTGSSGPSTTRCVTVRIWQSTSLLQFNGYAAGAETWHHYLVGASAGGTYVDTSGGKASEVEVYVDTNIDGRKSSGAVKAGFCAGSFDLCLEIADL